MQPLGRKSPHFIADYSVMMNFKVTATVSRIKKQFYKNTLRTMDLETFVSLWMMFSAVQISIDRIFRE